VASATCFCATLARVRRPATGRLNSGVRRKKAFCSCVVRSCGSSGFGQHGSSDKFSTRCRFGQARQARSSVTRIAVLGFGNSGRLTVSIPAPDWVASVTAGGEFAWRARASGLRFSACSQWLHARRLPSRLTTRSSRRRLSASLKLVDTRAILAPNRRVRRGLTQALGGKKHSAVASSALQLAGFGQHCSSDGSGSRCFFGQVRRTRSSITCVAFVGFGITGRLTADTFAPDAVASDTAGGRFTWRARASGLRSFGPVAMPSPSPASFAPRACYELSADAVMLRG
jgi:hypothetical protein